MVLKDYLYVDMPLLVHQYHVLLLELLLVFGRMLKLIVHQNDSAILGRGNGEYVMCFGTAVYL